MEEWKQRILDNGPPAPPVMWCCPMLDWDGEACNWDDACGSRESDGSPGDTKYIRADLAIRIPPEGPEREALVEKMARAMYWAVHDGGSPEAAPITMAENRVSAQAALAVLIGEAK